MTFEHAPDSTPTPTPVTDLGWRGVAARADGMATRSRELWYRFTKNILHRNMGKAGTCKALATELDGIAGRARLFPQRSDGALAGERAYIERRLVEIATLLETLGG